MVIAKRWFMNKGRRNRRREGETVRLSARFSILAQLPDCELGPAGCFPLAVHVSLHCFSRQEFCMVLGKATREETTRWAKLTVRQIELRLKTAPLAGLFRPTGRASVHRRNLSELN
jgi:hypothetical protein